MKQIIRLTESDLHKIIKESVKRVLREAADDDPEAQRLLQAWKDARASKDTDAMLKAKQAYQDYTGKHNEVVRLQQGVDNKPFVDAENAKRGIKGFDQKKGGKFLQMGDLLAKRAAARDTEDAIGPQINPELGIDLTN